MPHRLFPVDLETPDLVGLLHQVVHIDHPRRAGENGGQLVGGLSTDGGIRPVNFGHQGLQNGWPRRHLNHRNARAQCLRQRRQNLTRRAGDLVAGTFPRPFVQKLDLHIPVPGVLTQVIVAHQAIEIERRGRAGIGLDRHDLGDFQHFFRQTLGHVGGDRQGGAGRHVDHHVELRLVVEGQHLDRHILGVEQEQTAHEQADINQ